MNSLTKIGQYTVLRQITSTGSSDLYECIHEGLEIKVVVKIFAPKKRLLESLPYSIENWRNRFLNEARLLAKIDHPNVISVLDLAYQEGEPFYAMPYIDTCLLYEMGKDNEGESGNYPALYDDVPEIKKLTAKRSIEILKQIARGLDSFHSLGLVHRDIKPGNILLTRVETGSVKLCDPGFVKFPNSNESLADYWFGTRDYIAPEQLRCAKTVDCRADIFSLGVLGYRMLTGILPIGVIPDIKDECIDVPHALNDLIMSSLSNKNTLRPDNAAAFLNLLEKI